MLKRRGNAVNIEILGFMALGWQKYKNTQQTNASFFFLLNNVHDEMSVQEM